MVKMMPKKMLELTQMIGPRLTPNYEAFEELEAVLSVAIRSGPTQHNLVSLLPLYVSAGCEGRWMC